MLIRQIIKLVSILTISFLVLVKSEAAPPKINDIDAGIDFASTEPLFVSLGSFCGPAQTIEAAGLRKAAFPFDWCLSVNGEKIIEIIYDNFAYFFDVNFLAPFGSGILLHKHYQIEFSHEGDWRGNKIYENFPAFVEKYQRRIYRFWKLDSYKGDLFFVRQSWPLSTHPNYAFQDPGNLEIDIIYGHRLLAALKYRFPNAKVHLIILNSPQGIETINMYGDLVMIKSNCYSFQEIAKMYSNP